MLQYRKQRRKKLIGEFEHEFAENTKDTPFAYHRTLQVPRTRPAEMPLRDLTADEAVLACIEL